LCPNFAAIVAPPNTRARACLEGWSVYVEEELVLSAILDHLRSWEGYPLDGASPTVALPQRRHLHILRPPILSTNPTCLEGWSVSVEEELVPLSVPVKAPRTT